MLKLVGKDSGVVSGGKSKHQPPLTSDWFSGSQNSSERPLWSWYQVGKPPIWGSALTGPTRSRAAWEGEATARASRPTAADRIVLGSRSSVVCIFGIAPEVTPIPWRRATCSTRDRTCYRLIRHRNISHFRAP